MNGCPHLVAAKAFAEPYAPIIAGVSAMSEQKSAQFFDANIGAAFWMFPNDRKIKHLSLLRYRPEALSPMMTGKWRHSECVAYVPEKCATVRCQDRDGQTIAYAKMYAAAEGQSIAETYLQLASACTHVVKPLKYSQPYHLLLLEAVPGNRLADLKNKDLSDGFAGLAQALAALHSARVSSELPRFKRHDLIVYVTARGSLAWLVQILHELQTTSIANFVPPFLPRNL